MTEITTDPRYALAELEARILEGDTTVTATMLAKARDAAALAELHSEADVRRAALDAAAQREEAAAAFRRDLEVQAAEMPAVQAAYGSVVDALQALNDRVAGWQQRRAQFVARAHGLGLSGEADILADLGRTDWIARIADEAVGRFQTGSKRIVVGGLSGAAVVFHALHAPDRRAAIDRERLDRLTKSAARIAEREAEKRRIADADAAALRQAALRARLVDHQVEAAV